MTLKLSYISDSKIARSTSFGGSATMERRERELETAPLLLPRLSDQIVRCRGRFNEAN